MSGCKPDLRVPTTRGLLRPVSIHRFAATRPSLAMTFEFMRILYISSYYKPAYVYGGPAKSIAAMCEALARQGAQVTVLTTNANGDEPLNVPLEEPLNVDGVTVYYYPIKNGLPRSFFYSPSLARACEDMIREHDIVVLETLFTHPTGPAVKACLKWNKPYIVPLRGSLLPWALGQKALKKQVYLALFGRHQLNHAAGLQCSDLDELASVKRLNFHTPAFIIPNGLKVSHWRTLPPRGALRQRLGIPDTDRILLMLGRLHRVKNPELAVEMLGLLNRQDVHLVFVGPDEEAYQAGLQARASVLGQSKQIHFTGLLSGNSLVQAMADTDLFLMPSLSESFGMAALEAMVCGLPVLLSEHVPVGRWAEEAGAGRQVSCTPQAFAKACDEMLKDKTTLSEMGERARTLVFQRFDIDAVAKRLLAQYQSILSNGQLLDTQEIQFVNPKFGKVQ